MGHHHHHHGLPGAGGSLNRIFIVCIVLNLLFVGVEAAVGLLYHSLGLLSDAGHNLSDVFSLVLALVAFRLARQPVSAHFTYGYKKSTILISLVNAVILLVAVGAIIIESVYRLRHPQPLSGLAISWTAGVGIVVNGLTTWLLTRDRKRDLNVRGAFLHMLMDTLVSVGVVISGLVIRYTGWAWVDTAVSLAIAVVILVSTFNLLRESLFLSIDAVPSSVDLERLRARLDAVPALRGWHHLHVWAISTTENAATLHVVVDRLEEMAGVKRELKALFLAEGIGHRSSSRRPGRLATRRIAVDGPGGRGRKKRRTRLAFVPRSPGGD